MSEKRRTPRTRWLGRLWNLHRWLGHFFALPLLIVSISGALLVRYDWLERVGDPVLYRPPDQVASGHRPLRDVLQSVVVARPSVELRYLELPGNPQRQISLSILQGNERRTLVIDAVSGDVLLDRAERDGVRRWFLRLHDSLLMGKAGEVIVASSSLALIVSAWTGLRIYRGAWRGLWQPRLRWRGSWRLWMGDVHKFIGILSLAFLLIWGSTGALLTLPALLGVFGESGPRKPKPPGYDWRSAPEIEMLLAEAGRAFPGADIDYLSLPTTPHGSFTVSLLDREKWFWAKFKEVEFSGDTGLLVAQKDYANAGLLDKINYTVAVLHFGHQGSLLTRWVWLFMGFAPVFLVFSGCLIWWWRHKKKHQAVTGLPSQPEKL